jgi:hypothetical protein
MREIRTSGSEGGGIEANRCFLPLYLPFVLNNAPGRPLVFSVTAGRSTASHGSALQSLCVAAAFGV